MPPETGCGPPDINTWRNRNGGKVNRGWVGFSLGLLSEAVERSIIAMRWRLGHDTVSRGLFFFGF